MASLLPQRSARTGKKSVTRHHRGKGGTIKAQGWALGQKVLSLTAGAATGLALIGPLRAGFEAGEGIGRAVDEPVELPLPAQRIGVPADRHGTVAATALFD